MNSFGHLAMIKVERGHLRAPHIASPAKTEPAERRGWSPSCSRPLRSTSLALAQTELGVEQLQERRNFFWTRGLSFPAENEPGWIPYPALQAAQARLWLAEGQVNRARQVIAAA